MITREIKILETSPGYAPFEKWYGCLNDSTARLRVFTTITRLADPNYRGLQSVGSGVYELRIFYGPGYRVYCALKGNALVILLGGGTKKSQGDDIYEAKKLWQTFKNEARRTQRKFSA